MVGRRGRFALLFVFLLVITACGQGVSDEVAVDPAHRGPEWHPPGTEWERPERPVLSVRVPEKASDSREGRRYRWHRRRGHKQATVEVAAPAPTDGTSDPSTSTTEAATGNGEATANTAASQETATGGGGTTSTTAGTASTSTASTAVAVTQSPTTAASSPSTTARTTTTQTADPSTGLWPIYTPRPGCAEGSIIPKGQGTGGKNHEPLGSIWCFDLAEPPAKTAVEGANSWVDDFNTDQLMMRFDDGDLGYRIFNNAGAAPGTAQHWLNQNHWMVDMKGGFTGGTSLRPNRSFKFQNGKLVVEGDFAASIPEYGNTTWGELTITSAPAPTGVIADNLYAYGQFGGHWAVGCRLQEGGYPVCAVEGPTANTPADGRCSSIQGNYRVSEMSFFQRCGSSTMGGFPTGDSPWRSCTRGGPDMPCRDRFRMEITKSSLTLYVNGRKYFEDAGWPASHQLPDSFVNGDIYVYQSNWQWRNDSTTFRYHWDRFAVNPPTGPSAAG